MNSQNPILERILREAGTPDLLPVLARRLSASDLQSLMLTVYETRAEALTPAEVARQYAANRFVQPARIAPLATMAFDTLALGLLPNGFELLELSPVCPLGTCAVLGPVDPKLAVATVRNTEVCSDSTNVLALESAARLARGKRNVAESSAPGRSATPAGPVKLCASHRLVRAQRFTGPASFAHFRVLSLTTAGRDRGNHVFETGAMTEHLDFHLRLLPAAGSLGLSAQALRVRIIPFAPGAAERAETRVCAELRRRHPDVVFAIEPEGKQEGDYYREARFQIFATAPDGTEHFLADGGSTDWMQKLTGNRKERFFISGLGTDRFLSCFAAGKAGSPP